LVNLVIFDSFVLLMTGFKISNHLNVLHKLIIKLKNPRIKIRIKRKNDFIDKYVYINKYMIFLTRFLL